MEDFGAKEQAQASSNKLEKRGRRPKLTDDEERERKKERNRKYREKKAAEEKKKDKMYEELKKKHEEMKKKVDEQQLEINKLKEPLSEINAQADKLAREVSDEAATVNVVNMVSEALGPGMQQLQENFLNKDNKEHDAGNSIEYATGFGSCMLNSLGLEDFRLEGFEDFNELVDSYVSRTKGNEYIDNMTSPKALSGTAIDIPSSSMNKRAKRSKGNKNELIQEGFEMDAKVLAARNVTYKKINTHVVPMPENGIWNLLEKIGIDSQLITGAYVYFINNPEKVRAVLGCPREYRKEVVEKLVFGSLGH